METARAASAADLPAVAELLARAIAEIRQKKGGEAWWRIDAAVDPVAELSARLDDPDVVVTVGLIDDEPVGLIVAAVSPTREPSPIGLIEVVYVDAGARGVGVGECMLDHAIGVLEARGCDGFDSSALPGDRHTKNFFETFGFTARRLIMHRRPRG
ncbi:MAG TPA: GNAT family N-acetyltransferase [Acidimicrobiales bacterium]